MRTHETPNFSRRAALAIISILVLFAFTPVKAQDEIKNKGMIKDGFEKWAKGTGNFFDLLAEDMQWTITGSTPFSKTYTGKKQFIDEVIIPLNHRLSKKIVPKVIKIYADGDVVIALWDGKAIALDEKPYNASYCWTMQIKNGKIISVTAFLDGIEFADIMSRITLQK